MRDPDADVRSGQPELIEELQHRDKRRLNGDDQERENQQLQHIPPTKAHPSEGIRRNGGEKTAGETYSAG